MTYKYIIRSLYQIKYNTQTTYPILIPKYNTPNNQMIHKYKIILTYPKNTIYNTKTTNLILKTKHNTLKYIQKKPRKNHQITHINYINLFPKNPQPHPKINIHTKQKKVPKTNAIPNVQNTYKTKTPPKIQPTSK